MIHDNFRNLRRLNYFPELFKLLNCRSVENKYGFIFININFLDNVYSDFIHYSP